MDNIPMKDTWVLDGTPTEKQKGKKEEWLYSWLLELDEGRGRMLKYFDVLRSQFDADMIQIVSVCRSQPRGLGTRGKIEDEFCKACGVKWLGDRLLLGRGILQLQEQRVRSAAAGRVGLA